ncbi:MAG: InlB B-repeat-containing protein, partial [Fibromonadaceae bacterium]|nr:InlB B-repeat-containing protein [Fibromonadaceae bacterium]
SNATAPTAPTRAGYTFTGWSPAFTNVTSNLTVVAQWNIISYTVSFNSDGGSSVESQTINHGGTAVAPTAPTKAGHTFAGWHIGEATEAFDFENTPITANTTLTAKWTDISSIFANRENPKIGAIGIQTYYDLKGTSLGTTKPTAPGVYLEKHGTHVRRIAIR